MSLAFLPHLLAARSRELTSLHLSLTFSVEAILALVAGILILIRPKMLNFVLSAYLIALGLIGLLNLSW